MCAVQTKIGCWTCAGSDGRPEKIRIMIYEISVGKRVRVKYFTSTRIMAYINIIFKLFNQFRPIYRI